MLTARATVGLVTIQNLWPTMCVLIHPAFRARRVVARNLILIFTQARQMDVDFFYMSRQALFKYVYNRRCNSSVQKITVFAGCSVSRLADSDSVRKGLLPITA